MPDYAVLYCTIRCCASDRAHEGHARSAGLLREPPGEHATAGMGWCSSVNIESQSKRNGLTPKEFRDVNGLVTEDKHDASQVRVRV